MGKTLSARASGGPPGACQGYRIWLAACSGYLPPCGGGRIARHPKSAIVDFGVYLGQVGNILLVPREPGGGRNVRSIKQTLPSPSLPHMGGGRRMALDAGE